MILFISEYPGAHNEKDGMMQRVAAIDERFAGYERIYLKISFLRYLLPDRRPVATKAIAYRLNLFVHLPLILVLISRARIVYVHSVGNALAIVPAYLFKRVVTDLHGAVPEEFRMAGKVLAAWRYEIVERIAVKFSWRLVAVSSAMVAHINDKYRSAGPTFLKIPIFDDVPAGERHIRHPDAPLTVVYAGGVQTWQNIDLMLEAMRTTAAPCRYVILTGDETAFRMRAETIGLEGKLQIASVPKHEVYDHYRSADLGFVLRDDTLVNRVACPTKLVEYLTCGVVPIVIQPRIGDFADLGYEYVTLDDFIRGEIPAAEELDAMRMANYRVIHGLREAAGTEMERLVALCKGEGGASA
jgi:hypothetical protein